MNQNELTKLFRQLGAPDPEGWAQSQIEEGIPQLARFLFLRQAWRQIIPDGDDSWQQTQIEHADDDPEAPYAGVGQALKRLLRSGASPADLTNAVRGMQAQLLFALCYQLEDPGDIEPEAGDVAWGLYLLDENSSPIVNLDGLHESVLETDPTGREMRPKGDAA